jgi:hypothetical protein
MKLTVATQSLYDNSLLCYEEELYPEYLVVFARKIQENKTRFMLSFLSKS